MMTSHLSRDGTLASIRVGDRVQLRTFPFTAIRSVCADIGLDAGIVVRCLVASPNVLLLEREDGRQVCIDAEWARLIQVGAPPDGSAGNVK
jgi:hypothetical protein